MTRYDYGSPPSYALLQVQMTAEDQPTQTVRRWDVQTEGGCVQAEYRDQHLNLMHLVRVDPAASKLAITASGEVETHNTNGVSGPHHGRAPLWYFRRYSARTMPGPSLRAFLREHGKIRPDDVSGFHALSQHIHEKVRYRLGRTDATTTAEQAMAAGEGVCQDHAHVFVTLIRMMGLPARYISGYLMMDDRIDQEATHAWAEVYIDSLGWVAFDVSNGISADERYVRIATGLDYHEAAPLTGIRYGWQREHMDVKLRVEKLAAIA